MEILSFRQWKRGKPQTRQLKIVTSKSNGIVTKNRFDPLSVKEDTNSIDNSRHRDDRASAKKSSPKVVAPPPIFIKEANNFSTLIKCLSEHAEPKNFITKALANRSVKVSVSTAKEFRKLVRYLRESKTCFFTYQLKEDKPFKVVIRNLHYSVSPKRLKRRLLWRNMRYAISPTKDIGKRKPHYQCSSLTLNRKQIIPQFIS